MALTLSKTKPTLHCQYCGKRRAMQRFLAININQPKGEPNTYGFNLKKFLELINSQTMVKFPQYYCAMCSVCDNITYYGARNRSTTLNVIPT